MWSKTHLEDAILEVPLSTAKTTKQECDREWVLTKRDLNMKRANRYTVDMVDQSKELLEPQKYANDTYVSTPQIFLEPVDSK